MIKRLLPIFLSVCYVFAGERPSLIESNAACVAKGRVVSCTEVVDSGTCVATDARVAKNTLDEVTDLVVLTNPWSDTRLSPCPIHQRPPLFLVTLPRGQRIIFLGTTHTIPLSCMLPYGLAQDLIEKSSFTFNEINGTLLKGGCKKTDDTFDEEDIPEYVLVKKEDREKIEAGERALYEKIYNGERLEKEVEKGMASIFDSDGGWYERAGLLKRDDALGQIVKMLPANKELHPAALSYLYRVLTGSSSYQIPSCGGMDDHLDRIVSANYSRTLYALEEHKERFGEGSIKENRITLQESIASGCQNTIWYGAAVEGLLRNVGDVRQEVDIGSIDPSRFFSDSLPENKSLGLLERNDLWVSRIMKLDTELFNLAFGYVGRGHLVDLFRKLDAWM